MGTIDLNDYAVFCAVAEDGGFTAAARRLQIPKSSVSRAIGALEAEIGVRLLHRTTRRVALSTAGLTLYQRIAPQLEELRQAAADLPERQDEPSGLLRITTLPDLGRELVAPVAAKLIKRYPRLRVDIFYTERTLDLVAERVDVALRVAMRPMRDSSLGARRVGRVRMELFASPAYLARRGTPRRSDQLATHDSILIGGTAITPLDLGIPLPTQGRVHCNDGDTLLALLRAGCGIGTLPSYLVDGDVRRGTLVRVLPKWSVRFGDLWLVYPSSKQIPRKVAVFRDEIMLALKERPHLSL